MNAEDFEKYTIDYLKGKLNSSDAKRFESYVKDQKKENELEELRTIMKISSSWIMEETPSSVRNDFYTMLSKQEQQKISYSIGVLKRIDLFLGSINEYQNLKRVAFTLFIALMSGFAGYQLNGYFERTELSELNNQLEEMEVKIATIQLKSYSPSDRMKGINYANMQETNSDKLMDGLLISMVHDESVHIRIATAQALYKFHELPKIRLALEKALINETDPLAKLNLIRLVDNFNPELTGQEIIKLLNNNTVNPDVREVLEKMIKS